MVLEWYWFNVIKYVSGMTGTVWLSAKDIIDPALWLSRCYFRSLSSSLRKTRKRCCHCIEAVFIVVLISRRLFYPTLLHLIITTPLEQFVCKKLDCYPPLFLLQARIVLLRPALTRWTLHCFNWKIWISNWKACNSSDVSFNKKLVYIEFKLTQNNDCIWEPPTRFI